MTGLVQPNEDERAPREFEGRRSSSKTDALVEGAPSARVAAHIGEARIAEWLATPNRVVWMAVLNRTPDSFSDGGDFLDDARALDRARELCAQGADIIDVGAESSRPRAERVSADEQLRRLGDIVGALSALGALVSIDTTDERVARAALRDGACMINSVSLDAAPSLARVAAEHGARLALMHSRGSMVGMRGFSDYDPLAYDDVVACVGREWSRAADLAVAEGLPRASLLFDPGLGFHKNASHSIELCRRLDELTALGVPILVGPSRKSFVARAAGTPDAPPSRRLGGTIAAVLECVRRGARVVRVHDVEECRQATLVDAVLRDAGEPLRAASAARPTEGGRHVL